MERTVRADKTPLTARIALIAAIGCCVCALFTLVLLVGGLLGLSANGTGGLLFFLYLCALWAAPIFGVASLLFGGIGLRQSRRWWSDSHKGVRYSAFALIAGAAALLLTVFLLLLLFGGARSSEL